MRICFIVGAFPPMKCGVGDYTFNLVKELSNLSNDVHVITSKNVTVENENKFKIHNIVQDWSFKEKENILNQIRLINPDIVHIQYPSEQYGKSMFVNLLPMLIKRKFNVKIVETVHEYLHYTAKGKLRNLVNYKFADNIIVVEKQYIKKIKEFLPRISNKLDIHHIPITSNIPLSTLNEKECKSLKSHLGLYDEKVIVYFGFINELKGFETLLKSIYELKKAFKSIKLLVLSELDKTKEYHKKIIDMIENLGLTEDIIITGFITSPKDVSDYIKICDLAVLPFKEGVSERNGSFLAIYQQGIPIVTTTKEVCKNQNGVYYTEPDNVEAIVRFSNEILNCNKKNKIELLSWEKIAQNHIDIYGV